MAEPKVRFKRDDGSDYPAWREYSISDLFTKIGNKNKDGRNTNVITNSAEFGLIPQRDYFDKDIAVEGNTGNYTIIQTGDFVYNPRKSSYAPMGPLNCYRLEEDGIVSPLYSCLRPKGVLNPEYLLWYFQTDKWYGYVNDHGAQNGARHDRVGMTDRILMGIPVTAPCEEEQHKIADFLSNVDEVIAACTEKVANLETQKKAVMKKIFSREVRFKKDDGSDFPEWEEKKVAEACSKLCVGFVGTCERFYTDAENGIPMYRTGNIKNGQITCDDMKYVTKEFHQKNKKSQLHFGDVLIARFGDNGLGAIYNRVEEANCLNCIIAHPDEHILLVKYFQEFLGSDVAKKQVSKEVVGSTFGILNTTSLGGLNIVYPCLEEQRLIADFLSDFDEAISAAKKELELWKELKKGLLQQMFV